MEREQSVLGLCADGPIGMDHPVFAMRMEARRLAGWAAQQGLSLEDTLEQVRRQVHRLFGEVLQPLVDTSAATAWFDAAAARTSARGGDRG